MLVGTPGDDVICGFGGKDTLYGLAGNDTLLGGRGNDLLLGGRGHDQLFGDAGNDRIQPGPGNDGPVDGGAGSDTLDYTELTTGEGVSVRLPGSGSWYSSGGGGTDEILAGFEHLNGSRYDDPLLRAELDGIASLVQGFGGDDTIDTSDNDSGGPDTIDGGSGTDRCVAQPSDATRKCEPFVNQPPMADGAVRGQTNEDTPGYITLPVSDPDGETIDVFVTTPDSDNGRLFQVNPDGTRGPQITQPNFSRVTDPFLRVNYIPDLNDFGTPATHILYFAEDSSGATSPPSPGVSEGTLMFIDVAPVNDPPNAHSRTLTGFNTIPQIGITLAYSDPDIDDVLTGRFTELPENGKFYRDQVAPENEITPENDDIVPSDNFYIYVQPWPVDCRAPRLHGLNFDSFAYEVTDGEYSDSASHTIDIRYLNEPPLVDGPMSLTTEQDQAVEWWFDATDPDPEHDQTKLTFRILSLPQHGTLFFRFGNEVFDVPEEGFEISRQDPSIIMGYRPDAGYAGPDSFQWTVRDPEGHTPWCGDTTTSVTVQPTQGAT